MFFFFYFQIVLNEKFNYFILELLTKTKQNHMRLV